MDQQKAGKKGLRRAVALQYKPEKREAPVISATGTGRLADRIITLARENKIPIIEDNALAKVLGDLYPGDEIPGELFEAVAAVYAFVIEADRRRAGS